MAAARRFGELLALLPLPAAAADSAHDQRHLRRVLETAVRLAEEAGAALDVVVPAAWLHDLVQYPKSDPRNVGSSRESADAAVAMLRGIDYAARRATWFHVDGKVDGKAGTKAGTEAGMAGKKEGEAGEAGEAGTKEAEAEAEALYARIHHAVAAHSFSAGIPPTSLEAEVVRDADRLDAIGAIGMARMFAVSGALARPLYHELDPFAETDRALDDKAYAVDHFYNKLFKLTYSTPAAQAEATRRFAAMHAFIGELRHELGA